MKTFISLAFASIFLATAAATTATAEPVAIINATLHTGGGAGTVERGTLVMDGAKITAVGAGVPIPDGATIIDAGGAEVTPGFMNPYTHLGIVEIEQEGSTDDSDSGEMPYKASLDIAPGLNPASVTIPVTRVKGVTRAASVPDFSKSIFAGQAALLTLGDGEDFAVTPRAAMHVTVSEGAKRLIGAGRGAVMAMLRQAFDDTRYYARNRSDFDNNRARATALDRLDLEALIPVVDGRMLLLVDARRASDIRNIIALATEQKLKVALVNAEEAWMVAGELAAAKIPVIIDPSDNLPNRFEALNATLQNAARLHEAGVAVAFFAGGEQLANNPRNVRQLAGIAVANGLPKDAAYAALTTVPAAIWGIAERYGTLEPGKDADAVIWDGDPLEVTSAPTHVFILGRPISLETRQTKLRDRYRDLSGGGPGIGYR
ncbi:MAG: amidohydrolase family protein [Rhodobacteraceae bacterium]|nr:amidohydrolase family protein [Paracoccaceae bacterium]